MASWEKAHWESSLESGVPRSAARSGQYERYIPDRLDGLALAIGGDLSRRVTIVERRIRELNEPGVEGLAGIARFLLRSEAIASSRIEGITPSAGQVALAELGQSETVKGVSEQARLVANNMTVVHQSTTELVEAEKLRADHLVRLHQALLPDQPWHHGLRTVQNWVGGSNHSPIGADFIPPDPALVPGLLEDLVAYLNGSAHASLIQAALAHAQFETIHPFTDGNGRVGRALIHTVLARRGLTDQAILPISLVLATLRDKYVAGLSTYRHTFPAESEAAAKSINTWLTEFVEATDIAVDQASTLATSIKELTIAWNERLTAYRTNAGLRPTPRADSAVTKLLNQLPGVPVITATTLAKILDVSYPAANQALDELHQAGIMKVKRIEHGTSAYIADEILELITLTERALASTKFDTRISPPNRQVPALPGH